MLTLPPVAIAVVSSLAPAIVPLLTTLAPDATATVSKAINNALDQVSNAAASGISNATKATQGITDSIKNAAGMAATPAPLGTPAPIPTMAAPESSVTDDVSPAPVSKIVPSVGNGVAGSLLPVAQKQVTKEAENGGILPDTVKPFIIPVIGLVVGTAMMQVQSINMYGKLVLYFGAQSFMNIFMSWVLGTHVTIPAGTVLSNGHILEHDLRGCPAGFALTALQQVVSFVLFLIYFVAVWFTPYKYMPKHLKTQFEMISVVIFGCVFACNIALNNFSLGYISIGVNLIIRSCLPLSTYLSQQALAMVNLYTWKPFKVLEVTLMVVGVICACLFTWADFEGKLTLGGRFIGVLACLGSLLCGSLNLALAGVLGDNKLNVLDTCAYMAVPATLFLLPIIFCVSKPVPGEWKHVGAPSMTDWEILKATYEYSTVTILWLFLSGFFSFIYNICQFTIVHTLSPSATAFGGNFNKAALTFMTLLLPFLQTKPNPPLPYIAWEWTALLCNITAFSFYSYLQIQAKKDAEARAHKALSEEGSDEEEGSTESD